MANQPRFRATSFRLDPELRRRAQAAVGQVDSTLTAHVSAFLSWVVGDTDELPARPTARIPNEKTER